MSTITSLDPVAQDELLAVAEDVGYELVDGKPVERHMGLESSEVAARIVFLLVLFLRDSKIGRLFVSEASYRCFPDSPLTVRRPDVSFIRSGRFESERLPKGHCPIPPDLAIEVISPGDLAYDLEEKVAQYLRAGVSLVWLVYPPTRTVKVCRPRSSPLGSVAELCADDTISGEDVLPGFSCRVAEFFE